MGGDFTFDKERGLSRSSRCQLKMGKRPHMVFLGFGTQVAFLLFVHLESAPKHSTTQQRLKSNNHVGLEINN